LDPEVYYPVLESGDFHEHRDGKSRPKRRTRQFQIESHLTLFIMAAMAFAGIKIVPVYFANYQFRTPSKVKSRFALTAYPKRSQEDVREEVLAQSAGTRPSY